MKKGLIRQGLVQELSAKGRTRTVARFTEDRLMNIETLKWINYGSKMIFTEKNVV